MVLYLFGSFNDQNRFTQVTSRPKTLFVSIQYLIHYIPTDKQSKNDGRTKLLDNDLSNMLMSSDSFCRETSEMLIWDLQPRNGSDVPTLIRRWTPVK